MQSVIMLNFLYLPTSPLNDMPPLTKNFIWLFNTAVISCYFYIVMNEK
jgi:hypothetical protein